MHDARKGSSLRKSMPTDGRILSPGFRKIIGNAGWLTLDRAVRLGVGAFIGIWMARFLGPSQFGSLGFAISFVALFSTLTTLGLENIIVREVIRNPKKTSEILGTGFVLRCAGCAVAPLIAVVTIRLLQPDDHQALLLVSLLSLGLVFQAFDTIDSFFQSEVKSRLTVWARNSAFVLVAVGRVFLIEKKAPLWAFAAAQVVELGLAAIGLAIAYRAIGGRFSLWRFRPTRAIQLLSHSWPVILSGMAIMIYMRIDMVMLKAMQGDTAAGIYAAATRISEVWYFVPSIVVSSVSPAIMRAKSDPVRYYRWLAKLFSLMTFTALVVGSCIALSAKWIIHLLFSDAFRDAAPVLAVHVWASVFVFLGVAQAPWDLSENRLKLSFYRTLGGAVANIILNLVLIPRYSALGAAVATVISYGISSVFGNALSSVTRPIFFLQLQSIRFSNIWRKFDSVGGASEPL